MTTALEVAKYVNSLVSKGVDMDNAYGYQCMDLTVHIMKKYFNWWPTGNAIALATQPLPAGFTRIKVSKATDIKQGDVLVWSLGAYAQYGHTAIATEDGKADGTFVSVDQNWVNANLTKGSVAQPVKHNMSGVGYVIRPPYTSGGKTGTATVLVDALNVRDRSNRKGNVVATYSKGQSFNYDNYVVEDEHIWLTYIATSGARRYVAAGPNDGNPKNTWVSGF